MPYLFVLAAILLRILPHPWNLTPLGAMFLFSGATFRNRRDSLLVPLAALMLSDYAVIHFLYGGRYAWFTPYTWTGFLLVGLIGWTLRRKLTVGGVLGASLAGSVAFFLVSNFGVWMGWTLYPPTFSGLVECYVAALPFFRNTVLGDLAYAGLMFGTYAWVRRRRAAVAVGATS
ncbi:MAG TPA: DUF6580 family putative transport protein [Terriglobia bacterium]|nr:DUF6580 family putative transport protein [Terriglobia bacterium]